MDSGRFKRPSTVQKKHDTTFNSTIKSLNETISHSTTSQASNDQIQSDLASSRYFQAVFMKQHYKKLCERNIDILFQQICSMSKVVNTQRKRCDELKEKVTVLHAQKDMNKSLLELDQNAEAISKLILDTRANEKLKEIIEILKNVCSKLYLRNIEPMTTQQKYEDVQNNYVKCSKLLQEISHSTDISLLEKLLQLTTICKENLVKIDKTEETMCKNNLFSAVVECLTDKFDVNNQSKKENIGTNHNK